MTSLMLITSSLLVGAVAGASVTELPMWAQIAVAIGATVATALSGLLVRMLNAGFDYLHARTKWAFILSLKAHAVPIIVKLYEDEVKLAKDAALDGKLTDAEKRRFVTLAKQRLIQLATPQALRKHLGAQASDMLVGIVEEAVAGAKYAGKIAKAADRP